MPAAAIRYDEKRKTTKQPFGRGFFADCEIDTRLPSHY
jgi:hypothetical protein